MGVCNRRLWLCVVVLFVIQCCAQYSQDLPRDESLDYVADNVNSVCEIKGCNCTSDKSRIWNIVNCTFNNQQVSFVFTICTTCDLFTNKSTC